MRRQIVLVICLILLIGMVSAVPSIPHAFRGDAKYTNGQNIPDGYIVTAKLDNQPISTTSIVKDGKYGYDDPLLVSDIIGDGKKVYFYINGKLVENEPVNFIIGEVTNLDLTVKSPPSDFDDDTSHDDDDGNGDSPSGGSSPKSVTSKDGLITITAESTNTSDEQDDDILSIESLNQQGTGPGITGGVIGFVKSRVGMGFIFAVLLLIVGIGVVSFRKKRKQPTSSQSSENEEGRNEE